MAVIHGQCQRCGKTTSLIACHKFGRNRRLCVKCKQALDKMTVNDGFLVRKKK